ncbi:hypothetical protein VMT65_12930 [Nocardia sp. CDC153]|uniref:hypothetical protein n=1 Tax=Nocardia sp. CDC153 TaxID=3112167 RepID=UPI002DBF3B26|nr:hypothetical protein [Nocardia sp. CDC153]MEC3953933.1 hypothetical protein [Nocardia sp. CDC153]
MIRTTSRIGAVLAAVACGALGVPTHASADDILWFETRDQGVECVITAAGDEVECLAHYPAFTVPGRVPVCDSRSGFIPVVSVTLFAGQAPTAANECFAADHLGEDVPIAPGQFVNRNLFICYGTDTGDVLLGVQCSYAGNPSYAFVLDRYSYSTS